MARKLSYARRARADILAIGRYTEKEWGVKQRNLYLAKLFAAFEKIRVSPQSGKKREDLATKIRFVRVEKHVVIIL